VLENISNPPQLENQAAIAGLSKSHYCRAFKASMGISPHQWLLKARIEMAKQYKLTGGMPLAQVALATGFTDQAHFTHTFSKYEEVSPRAWQRTRATSPEWMTATVFPFTPASD
jgi:AraC family transcriptional regulator